MTTENEKDEKELQEAQEQYANQIVRQINTIAHMVKEYFTVLSPNEKMTGYELTLLGLNCVQAGLLIVKDGCDESNEDVNGRKATFEMVKNTMVNTIDSTYLNEELITKMVASKKASELEEDLKTGAIEK